MNFLKATAKKVLGYERGQQLRQWLYRITLFGLARYCPCCKASLRKFRPFGLVPRKEALCPVCRSLERHRLIWLYFSQKTDLLNGKKKRMLHVAPEAQLSQLFNAPEHIDYLSADLMNPSAMVKMDITDIQYPDNTFDVIYCSHVLEHILDDRKAMREFCRVLKDDGWAILQVPITDEATFEDPSVTSPEERERIFGQYDHVRRYGPDYEDRLAESGFSVTVDGFVRELDEKETKRFGLTQTEDVYFCKKASDSTGMS